MPNNRRKFDEEFKKRAARLSYASERSVKGIAESVEIVEIVELILIIQDQIGIRLIEIRHTAKELLLILLM